MGRKRAEKTVKAVPVDRTGRKPQSRQRRRSKYDFRPLRVEDDLPVFSDNEEEQFDELEKLLDYRDDLKTEHTAYSSQVVVNLPDQSSSLLILNTAEIDAGLLRECLRVLKPGGRVRLSPKVIGEKKGNT